jgi:hypothetical protein
MTLQQILARAVGDDAILNGSHVVDFTDDGSKVNVRICLCSYVNLNLNLSVSKLAVLVG